LLRGLDADGRTMVTRAHITSIDQLPKTDIIMFNTAPAAAVDILGSRIPRATAHQLQRFRHGPAAATISLAVEDGIPWTYAPARRAGTVHVGGSLPEIGRASCRGRG